MLIDGATKEKIPELPFSELSVSGEDTLSRQAEDIGESFKLIKGIFFKSKGLCLP